MKIFGFNDYIVLNESFKSSKLRKILQQHGMPKHDSDKKFLYDLEDSEVLGVAWDYTELNDFEKDDKNKSCYGIDLDDGCYLVIGNIDGLWYSSKNDFERKFKMRRDKRHPGNEFNDIPSYKRKEATEDSAVKKLKQKRGELLHSRNVSAFKNEIGVDGVEEFTKLIRDKFEEHIDNCVSKGNFEYGSCEFEIEFNDKKYNIYIEYGFDSSSGSKRGGVYVYDVTYTPDEIFISDDADREVYSSDFINDPDFGKEFWKKLLDGYEINDLEGDVYDEYEYNGVSRGDFY